MILLRIFVKRLMSEVKYIVLNVIRINAVNLSQLGRFSVMLKCLGTFMVLI